MRPRAALTAFGLMLAAPACADGPTTLGGIEVPAYGIVAVDRAGGRMARAEGAAELSADGRTLRPFTSATPVRIASVSKLVVALALHRLADAGRIDLDADVSRYLGWRLRNPDFPDSPISIRQMMRMKARCRIQAGISFRWESGCATWWGRRAFRNGSPAPGSTMPI